MRARGYRLYCSTLFAILALTGTISAGIAHGQETFPDVVQKVKQSVVGVGVYSPLGTITHHLQGTGFVVGNGRYVVTNYHVASAPYESEFKSTRVVFVPQGSRTRVVEVEKSFTSERFDLAILQLTEPLTPVAMAPADSLLREGSDIGLTGFPIGAALGLFPATHKGIVAAHTPNIIPAHHSSQLPDSHIDRLQQPFVVYQLDVVAYPGNSGSPVYHAQTGAVVGVVNKVLIQSTKESAISSPSGITYAVPVKYIYELAEKNKLTLD